MLWSPSGECKCSCNMKKKKKSLNNNNNRGSSSSSLTRLSSSTSAPSYSYLNKQTPRSSNNKSMEDVWKDINLASLTDHTSITHNNHHQYQPITYSNLRGGVNNFHDFLAPPLTFTIAIHPPNNTTTTSSKTSSSSYPPFTALSLNSLPLPHHNPASASASSKVDPLVSTCTNTPFQSHHHHHHLAKANYSTFGNNNNKKQGFLEYSDANSSRDRREISE